MTEIFNESSVRQGRPFWHYGKSFETVNDQFARYVHREWMIGAYFEGELVGFIMLANAGRFGVTGQIISSLRHRDKSPNNALIAKAVEVCAREGLGYLIYLFWSEDSLAEFKALDSNQCACRAIGYLSHGEVDWHSRPACTGVGNP